MDISSIDFASLTLEQIQALENPNTAYTARDTPTLESDIRAIREFARSPLIAPESPEDVPAVLLACYAAYARCQLGEEIITRKQHSKHSIHALAASYSTGAQIRLMRKAIYAAFIGATGAEIDFAQGALALQSSVSHTDDPFIAEDIQIDYCTGFASKTKRLLGNVSIAEQHGVIIKDISEYDDVMESAYQAGGVWFVTTVMGSGKTSKIIDPLREKCEQSGDEIAVHTMPKRAIARAYSSNPSCYTNMELEDVPTAKSLITVINSLSLKKFARFSSPGVLVIDEIGEILSHNAGTAFLNLGVQRSVVKMLKSAIRSARLVLIADATAGQREIDYIKSIRKDTINVVTDSAGYAEKVVKYSYDDSDYAVVAHAGQRLAEGKPIAVFCDYSSKKVIKLVRSITAASGRDDLRIKIVDAAFSKSDEEYNGGAFMSDLTSSVQDYDLVVFTPVVSSGVSITCKYFEHGYVFTCGTVSPRQAIQMTGRFRETNDWTLALKKVRKFHGTSTRQLLTNYAALNACADEIEDFDSVPGGFVGFMVEQQRSDNKMRNEFADQIVIGMQGMGFSISRLETTAEQLEIGESSSLKGWEEEEAEYLCSVLECVQPGGRIVKSNAAYLTAGQLNEGHAAAVGMAYAYGTTDFTDELFDYDRRGIGRRVIETVAHVSGSKSTQSEGGRADKLALVRFIEMLGVSHDQGRWSGTFTRDEMQSAFDFIYSEMKVGENRISVAGVLMANREHMSLPRKSRARVSSVIASVLAELDMKVVRVGRSAGVTVYAIASSWKLDSKPELSENGVVEFPIHSSEQYARRSSIAPQQPRARAA